MTPELALKLTAIFKADCKKYSRQASECVNPWPDLTVKKGKEKRYERKILLFDICHTLMLHCYHIRRKHQYMS